MSFFFAVRSMVLGAAAGVGVSAVICPSTSTKAETSHSVSSFRPSQGRGAESVGLDWGVQWEADWDQAASSGAGGGRAVRQLVMIRHGQYHHDSPDCGKREEDMHRLTPLGHAQAYVTGVHLALLVQQALAKEQTANALKAAKKKSSSSNTGDQLLREAKNADEACGTFLLSPRIRTMYVSNMIRARETVIGIRKGMQEVFDKISEEGGPGLSLPPLLVDETLMERYPCAVEPRTSSGLPKSVDPKQVAAAEDVFHRYFFRPQRSLSSSSYSSPWSRWLGGMWTSVTSLDFIRSATRARYPSHTQNEENTVDILVMHSNMIRYLLLRALQLPPEAWLRLSTPHCSITSFKITDKGYVSLSCYGSYGHLLPDQITTRNTH